MDSPHYAPVFDSVMYSFLFLIGVFYTYSGLGFSLKRLFGKAFIIIDNEEILVKLDAFDKKQQIQWRDIKSIIYKSNSCYIIELSDKSRVLNLSKLDHSLMVNVKEVMSTIARENGLTISNDQQQLISVK